MKKLKLNLDDLKVESFVTKTEAKRTGTAVGFAGGATQDQTCPYSCVDTHCCVPETEADCELTEFMNCDSVEPQYCTNTGYDDTRDYRCSEWPRVCPGS